MIVDVFDFSFLEFLILKEFKWIVLIVLCCVDLEIEQRFKMGDVIYMFQLYDLLLNSNVIDDILIVLF